MSYCVGWLRGLRRCPAIPLQSGKHFCIPIFHDKGLREGGKSYKKKTHIRLILGYPATCLNFKFMNSATRNLGQLANNQVIAGKKEWMWARIGWLVGKERKISASLLKYDWYILPRSTTDQTGRSEYLFWRKVPAAVRQEIRDVVDRRIGCRGQEGQCETGKTCPTAKAGGDATSS